MQQRAGRPRRCDRPTLLAGDHDHQSRSVNATGSSRGSPPLAVAGVVVLVIVAVVVLLRSPETPPSAVPPGVVPPSSARPTRTSRDRPPKTLPARTCK